MVAFIYCFTFPNGKKYIGFASKNVKHRWAVHKHRSKKDSNVKLYNAIKKYGFENIEKIILEEHPDKEYALKILEPLYIKKFNSIKNGYNSIPGGGKFPVLKGCDNPGYKRKGKPMKTWFTEDQLLNHKSSMKTTHYGNKNVHARKVIIISPEGIKYQLHGELFSFCKKMELYSYIFWQTLDKGGGTIPPISKKATKLKYIERRTKSIGWSIFPAN